MVKNRNIKKTSSIISTLMTLSVMCLVSSCAFSGLAVSSQSETTNTIAISTTYYESIPEPYATTTLSTEPSETTIMFTNEEIAVFFARRIAEPLYGRPMEDSELLEYAESLVSGNLTINDFVTTIVRSEEFVSLELSNSEYVEALNLALYNGLMSDVRKNFLIDQLDCGVSRESIIPLLTDTEEFISLCHSYNLSANDLSLGSIDDLFDIVSSIPEGEILSSTNGYFPSDYIITDLNEEISALNDRYGHVGFILIDVSTGRGITYNVDHKFYSASSIKGPYAISLCYNFPELVTEEDYYLSTLLINSDNESFRVLFTRYGRQYIIDWAVNSGVGEDVCRWKYPKISSRDMFRLWISNYQYLNSGTPEAEILRTWFQTPEYSLIRSELGDRYITESKAGWLSDEDPTHTTTIDAGIVYASTGDYIVVIESTVPMDIEPLRPLMRILDAAHDDMSGISY